MLKLQSSGKKKIIWPACTLHGPIHRVFAFAPERFLPRLPFYRVGKLISLIERKPNTKQKIKQTNKGKETVLNGKHLGYPQSFQKYLCKKLNHYLLTDTAKSPVLNEFY